MLEANYVALPESATLIETLRKAEAFLAQKQIPSPRLEAQLIFAHFLQLKRIELFTQPERPLSAAELESLRAALRQRISGMPNAHIVGTKEFYGRPFRVNGAVLIPRPETEELVEQILLIEKSAEHIVDLGSGSGCIGVTLAAEMKPALLTLVDISTDTLAVARENAAQHLDANITQCAIIHADFRGELPLQEKANIVVSNPPYVLPEEFASLDKSVRDFEPRVALVADDFAGLHRALIAQAFLNLASGGLFALETHPLKSAAVADGCREAGFDSVEIRNDFAGRPHFIFARKKEA